MSTTDRRDITPRSAGVRLPRFAIVLWTVATLAGAAEEPASLVLPGTAEVACEADGPAMACRYRVLPPGQTVSTVTARLGGVALDIIGHTPYPHADARSTVLFLVDPGDAGQRAVLAHKKTAIEAILRQASDHHRFGLATVDSELELIELPVNGAADIVRALKVVEPAPDPTELFRTTLIAVRLLAKQTTERKGIILVSDGQADDTAYFARDVIEAAQAGDVVIIGAGFAPAADAVAALQNLRRLGEETGGEFVAADGEGRLPAEFLAAPFRAVDYGGRFRIMSPTGKRLSGMVEIKLTTARGTYTARVPGAFAAAGTPASGDRAPMPPPRIQRLPEADGPSALDLALLGGFLVLFGFVAYLLVRRIRAGGSAPGAASRQRHQPKKPEARVHGVLEFAGEPHRAPIPLQGESLRIGRNADNEIQLEDGSVSRHHAQIHRGPDGAYVVSDLNSLNGVYVNGRHVQSSQLKEGDKVEIGDVGLRFRLVTEAAGAEPFTETLVSYRHD